MGALGAQPQPQPQPQAELLREPVHRAAHRAEKRPLRLAEAEAEAEHKRRRTEAEFVAAAAAAAAAVQAAQVAAVALASEAGNSSRPPLTITARLSQLESRFGVPDLETRKSKPPIHRLCDLEKAVLEKAVGFDPATFNLDQRIKSLMELADAELC